MNFIKNIFGAKKKEPLKGAFFNSSEYEMKNLLCGIGKSEIQKNNIYITDYPFEPSIVYPQRSISSKEIDSISVDFGVSKIYSADDIIFVSSEKKDALKKFAAKNKIALSKHNWNWNWILEPYIDTEFTEENKKRIAKKLNENGIGLTEVDKIQNEVKEQMYKYNFDTMLWDWCSLGLPDVLSAMRVKYNTKEFREFYKRAIEIDKREKNTLPNIGYAADEKSV